jgi:hypothetical protein
LALWINFELAKTDGIVIKFYFRVHVKFFQPGAAQNISVKVRLKIFRSGSGREISGQILPPSLLKPGGWPGLTGGGAAGGGAPAGRCGDGTLPTRSLKGISGYFILAQKKPATET